MWIRKNRYIELDRTCCCIRKFNVALSLCEVLGVTLYFSKSFLKAAVRESAVTKVLQPLGVTIVCFLGQKSNLLSPILQQRYRLFSKYFLYLSLINLLLLANLEKRSTHGELDCFLEVGDNVLKRDDLVDEATGDVFALPWEAMALPLVEALSYFQE